MKTCKETGCNNPVWSKGVCRKHTPRTPLKIVPKTWGLDDGDKRNNFFMSIWTRRPHVCQICDKKLGREPRSYMFDHLLEKSSHATLMWEPENILLVCLECHDKKSRGIITEKYQERINFVRTKFNV